MKEDFIPEPKKSSPADLKDSKFVHSIETGDLFKSGDEGQEEVLERIEKIENDAIKNDGYFRIAEMFYENNGDMQSALETVREINNEQERARCLVRLAVAILKKEGNLEEADQIAEEAGSLDEQGEYSAYYEKERQDYLDGIEEEGSKY